MDVIPETKSLKAMLLGTSEVQAGSCNVKDAMPGFKHALQPSFVGVAFGIHIATGLLQASPCGPVQVFARLRSRRFRSTPSRKTSSQIVREAELERRFRSP